MSESPPRGRLSPGSLLPWLAASALPVALVDGGVSGLLAAFAMDGALGAGAILEGRRLRGIVPSARRILPGRLVVGIPQRVRVDLHNLGSRTLRTRVHDAAPASFHARPEEQLVVLPPHARRSIEYVATPTRRGDHRFGALSIRVEGRAGLSALTVDLPLDEPVKVYPNVLGNRRTELARSLGDLRSLGSRSIRASGGGGDLALLREYVAGDPYRHVSWKATAKRGRPVSRVFDQERSQQVILCLDAGCRMAADLDGLPKLDHALAAALLLAWVALHNGDRVGAVVFSDEVERTVPPRGGIAQYRRLLEGLYDIEPSPTHADFRGFAREIREKVRSRSLLLVFSDLLEDAQAGGVIEYLGGLRDRHLPICVTTGDPVAERRAAAPLESTLDVYDRAAALGLLEERRALEQKLRKVAVGWLEAPPGALALAAIRRYLEIKAKRAL